ncbi:MAG: alpha/beta hydrolase, partial [Myxococcota bacterium]
ALVVATSDPFLPPPFLRQAVVDRLPHAGLAHVPGPGHYLPVEQPAVFAALIEAFVTGTPSTGTRSLTPA